MPVNQPLAANSYQTPEQLLTSMVNGGKPLIEVLAPTLESFAYLLFDTEELFTTDTSKNIELKFKNLAGAATRVMTNGQCQLEWREKIRGFSKTTVLQPTGATGATTIRVTDISGLQGIGKNTSIRIRSTIDQVDLNPATNLPFPNPVTASAQNPIIVSAIVTDIVPAIVGSNTYYDLVLDRTVVANAGDEVFRGANHRNLCGDINNTYTFTTEAIYSSNFQNLQLSMNFQTCELSQDRLMYAYNQSTQDYIDSLWLENKQGFLRELVDILYWGENVSAVGAPNAVSGPIDVVGAARKSQTRGIFTSIQEAQEKTGNTYIYDLIGCCGTEDDDSVIDAFVTILEDTFKSGYYNAEPITAVINSRQMSELMRMRASFLAYAGLELFSETRSSHAGMRDYVTLKVIGMEIEQTAVEYVLETGLDEYFPDTPVMILMPKKMVGFYQRKNDQLDGDMKIRVNEMGYPTLKMTDISQYENFKNGGDECYAYVGKIEFATAFGGIYNGAWRVIKNLKSFRSCNPNACTPVAGIITAPRSGFNAVA